MNVSFIVTLVGEDRPGLVSALAERAAANGANWLDSSMAQWRAQEQTARAEYETAAEGARRPERKNFTNARRRVE